MSTKEELSSFQNNIYEILVQLSVYKNADKDLSTYLFDKTALLKYWRPVFTEPSSNSKENIKTYYLSGKAVLNFVFSEYCLRKFGPFLSEEQIQAMQKFYLGDTFLAGFATEYRLAPLYPNRSSDEKFLATLFTSFIGALNTIYHDRVGHNLGSLICFNVVIQLYSKIEITYENLDKSHWNRLKELIDKDPTITIKITQQGLELWRGDSCLTEQAGNKRKDKEELAKKALHLLSVSKSLVSTQQNLMIRNLLPQLKSENGMEISDYLIEKRSSYMVQDKKYFTYSFLLIDKTDSRIEMMTTTKSSESEAVEFLVHDFVNRFGHLNLSEISVN